MRQVARGFPLRAGDGRENAGDFVGTLLATTGLEGASTTEERWLAGP